MAASWRFLVAESEPRETREKRRASVGRSSGETYVDTLRALVEGAACDEIAPADPGAALPRGAEIAAYDGVFLTGSPLHLYAETPEVRREIDFMRAVFASGTPSFGSCAGLQVATVAAGGTVRPSARGAEAGVARRVTKTKAGGDHPLLAGRPDVYDALTIHSDEVEALPADALRLAQNDTTRVQAAEIRSGAGVFWGVQYHPELSLGEIAAALRRQVDDLAEGEADSREAIERRADLFDQLEREPQREDLAAELGVGADVTNRERRRLELRNFIAHLAGPTRSARGRG